MSATSSPPNSTPFTGWPRAFGLSATDLLAMCESELAHRTTEKTYRSGDFKFRQVKYANAVVHLAPPRRRQGQPARDPPR
ncbi:MAG: hypothetical protein WDM96_18305 [Lacunisphaera sp.]